MSLHSRELSPRTTRFLAAAGIAGGLLLGACSGGSEVAVDGAPGPESGFISSESERAQLEEELSSVPEALGNVDEQDGAETTTSTTSTTTTSTTTTTEAPSGIVEPDVAGATADRTDGLGVITAPDDPLNVRLGPGTEYGIIAELEHQTVGITSTHIIDVGTVEWRFIEIGGEPVGWVAGRFLQRTVSESFCQAPAAMPAGLVAQNTVSVKLDDDLIPDEVALFEEALGGGESRLWIRSDMSSGGVASGVTGRLANAPANPELDVQFMTNTSRDGFANQFLVEIRRDGSYSDYQVFDLQGCDIETTTLDGSPFVFKLGNGPDGVFGSGCVYGGGQNRFVTFNNRPASSVVKQFALTETVWAFETQTSAGVDDAVGEWPMPEGFTSCLEG